MSGAEFDEFVADCADRLGRLAYQLTGDHDDAVELLGQALPRIRRGWGGSASTERPYDSARRQMISALLDAERRRSRSGTVELIDEPTVPGAGGHLPETDVVWKGLATLPAQQRAALVLHYLEDPHEADVAGALGRRRRAVADLLSRGLAELRLDLQLSRPVEEGASPTDDEIVELLRDASAERERYAPAEGDVVGLARQLPAAAPSRRGRTLLVAVAVTLAVALGIGAAWRAELLPFSAESSGATVTPGQVTVFLARPRPQASGESTSGQAQLVPLTVPGLNTGKSATDALHALFTQRSSARGQNWLLPDDEQWLDVQGVTITPNLVTVDLTPLDHDITANPYAEARCAAGGCPDPNLMVQQVAWTTSTALRSQAPITFTIDGQPADRLFGHQIDEPGLPNPYAIAPGSRDFSWYREACGEPSATGVLEDGTTVPLSMPRDGSVPSLLVIKAGKSATLRMTGVCFRELAVDLLADEVASVRSDADGRPVLTAQQAGRTNVTIAVTAPCAVQFGRTAMCPGPSVSFANFDLLVQAG